MSVKRATLDTVAFGLLLDGRTGALEGLLKRATAHAQGEVSCPHCEAPGPHDHNGDAGDPLFCCAECGFTFADEGVALDDVGLNR